MSKSLIGKTIVGISIATDKKAIKLDLSDGGSLIGSTEGDCCCETWFEHVDNPELAVGAPVLAVEDIPLQDSAPFPGILYERTGFIRYYGFKIKTAKAEMLLEYRASNGYYGGSLHSPDQSNFYGGVDDQNVSNEEWTPIAAIRSV